MLKAFEARVVNKCSGLIHDSESRIMDKVEQNDKNNELRVKSESSNFQGEVQDFKRLAKERHVLFVQDVKKVREDVNMQIRELREDMSKEIANVQLDYASFKQKVNIICDVFTKYFKLYEHLSPQIAQLSTIDNQSFVEDITLLKELKDLTVMPASSSLISP